MYLKKVEVTLNDHYYLKKGFSINNLKNVTLIVGDQGCGKSSMLSLISENKGIDVELTEMGKQGVTTRYFDFEKDNPRTINPKFLSDPNGNDIRYGPIVAIRSKWESHGEVLIGFSIDGLNKGENCIFIFDEPESSLSVRNQYGLIKAIDKAVSNKCQVIIATHCLPLIQSQEEVYSMEHKKWMKSSEFIDTQKLQDFTEATI